MQLSRDYSQLRAPNHHLFGPFALLREQNQIMRHRRLLWLYRGSYRDNFAVDNGKSGL